MGLEISRCDFGSIKGFCYMCDITKPRVVLRFFITNLTDSLRFLRILTLDFSQV